MILSKNSPAEAMAAPLGQLRTALLKASPPWRSLPLFQHVDVGVAGTWLAVGHPFGQGDSRRTARLRRSTRSTSSRSEECRSTRRCSSAPDGVGGVVIDGDQLGVDALSHSAVTGLPASTGSCTVQPEFGRTAPVGRSSANALGQLGFSSQPSPHRSRPSLEQPTAEQEHLVAGRSHLGEQGRARGSGRALPVGHGQVRVHGMTELVGESETSS